MEYCSIQLVIANTLVYQFLALKSLIKDLMDIVLDRWQTVSQTADRCTDVGPVVVDPTLSNTTLGCAVL